MRIYTKGTVVRLSKKQPSGSGLDRRYPGMRGTVIFATLGMTRVLWKPSGTTPGIITHYNAEIVRCNMAAGEVA